MFQKRDIGLVTPTDNKLFVQQTMSTRMVATISFEGADAGKTAFYRFRYVNTRGDLGPMSMVYNATIAN